MKRKITRLALTFILCGPGITLSDSLASDSLLIQDAVRLALLNYPSVQQAVQLAAASQAGEEQSKSPFYPEVKTEASYSRVGPVPTLELPGPTTVSLFPANNYDFHVVLKQTLFDFGRTSTGVDLARFNQEAAGQNVELVKSKLVYATVETFYQILFLKQSIVVLDEQIDALDQHLAETEKRVHTGSATDFDVLTTQVRVAAIQSQKVEVVNALQKQESILRQLTGLPLENPIQIKGDFSVKPLSLNQDSLIFLAKNQLPEMRLSRIAEASHEVQYRLASLGNKPTLKMNLEAGFKNGYIRDLDVLKGNWVAGMEVSVPAFDGYKTRSLTREASAMLDAARAHTQEVELQVITRVEQAISDVEASELKLKASQPQLDHAKEAVKMATVRYNAGVITNLDLLDAQTSLSYAELVHLQAQYELVISQYALEKAVGAKIWETSF